MIRACSVLLALVGIAFPALAAKQVTVAEFEQTLQGIRSKPDADTAWQIANLQLTERLSAEEFSKLESALPGNLSKQALRSVADQSAFFDPPAAELPSKPSPDFGEQRRMMGLVVAYVQNTIPQLPNLLASRETIHFRDTPTSFQNQGKTAVRYEPLHETGRSNLTISYNQGREGIESDADAKKKPSPLEPGLSTWGEFGPILTTVLLDAAQNKLAWSHWEQQGAEMRAVFSYSVPREKSHYEVDYCCIENSENNRSNLYRQVAAYHGEMAIDPATGAILRLTIEASLKPGEPVAKAAIVVEYGAVEIGGKNYICPIRALALSSAQSETTDKAVLLQVGPRGAAGAMAQSVQTSSATQGAEQALLNESIFDQYHVFRAEARIVTGGEAADPLAPHSAAELARALPALGSQRDLSASETSSASSATPPENSAPPTTANASAPAAPTTPSAPPVEPEIVVASTNQPPNLAASPSASESPSGVTLRTITRLVDVSLVAYDKKGHPVTDLKPGDFELYDNGRKQEIRFFNPANAEPTPATQSDQTPASSSPATSSFTNRSDNENRAASTKASADANTTVLMVDGGHVDFSDLTKARLEMLRFLKTVAPDEKIGLYILRTYGFEILTEPTFDHARVATLLQSWMPNAQDLLHAQDEEQRNRQGFDTVHNVTDLANVNGNGQGGNDPEMYSAGQGVARAAAYPPDDALRPLGDRPEDFALHLLVGVGRHLAAIPGHKTLVWISSDNALADFSAQAVGREDTGNHFLTPAALRAKETLNEAHVSIYPLDVSQLEASIAGADIGSRNVTAVGYSDRDRHYSAVGDAAPIGNNGRDTARMQEDTHPIQGAFRDLAYATGGRPFRRAGDIAAELNSVIADGRAAYLLSFAPDTPADDQYHVITVKITTRRDLTLRYRAGYFFTKEPATFKDRFTQAVWAPRDLNEIALTVSPVTEKIGPALKLTIDATALQLAEKDNRWTDRLDVFLALRDDSGLHAKITGHFVGLNLLPGTYQQSLKDGIPFEQPIDAKTIFSSARIVVVDENSGRIGSVTAPAEALTLHP